MTFTIQKKALMKKLRKRRRYEKFLTSHFSGRLQKFDKLNEFGDSDDEEENVVDDDAFDETGVFYSWECVSFVKRNGSTLDLVIPSSPDLLSLIHIVHRRIYH